LPTTTARKSSSENLKDTEPFTIDFKDDRYARSKEQVFSFQVVKNQEQTNESFVKDFKTVETNFVFNDLKHFCLYKISIKTCRKPHMSDISNMDSQDGFTTMELQQLDESERCGPAEFLAVRTPGKLGADEISKLVVEKIGDDQNFVRISWESPRELNGIIISFTIKMENLTEGKSSLLCIRAKNQQELYNYEEEMRSGDWKFSIAATSLAGRGPYSKPIGLSF
jgi:hypothetical protein